MNALRKEPARLSGSKAVAINDVLDEPVSFEDTKVAFKEGFEKGLNVHLEPFHLSEEQWEEVRKIAGERYETDEWNYAR